MKKSALWLFVIIALGLSLRLFVLSQRGSLWFDEVFSVHFAAMDIPRMLAYLRFENNPPLYFIILHFWMKMVGNSELAVRALSVILGMGAIPLVYGLGRRLHSFMAGLFAAFLTAISSFQIIYATETRMYTLYLFLALLAIWWFVKKGTSLFLFIILALLVWTHTLAWTIVLALAVYLLWQAQFKVRQFIIYNSKFLILVTLVALQFSPWIINFIQLKIATPLSQGYFFYIPPDKNFLVSILENFLVFGQDNAFIVTLLSVLIVGLLWFAIRGRQGFRNSGGLASIPFLLCWLFVPLLVGFAFQNAIPRYFIAASPALYLLMGIGFANIIVILKPKAEESLGDARSHIRARSFTAFRMTKWVIPVLVFSLVLPDYPSLMQIGRHEWDKVARWVEQSEGGRCPGLGVGCLIVINPHSEVLPFEHYYRGKLPVVGLYPRQDADDRDARIVKTNWISLNDKENIRVLADITAGYERVFLVTGGVEPIGRNIVPTWFWENGWRRGKSQEFGKISVMVLER